MFDKVNAGNERDVVRVEAEDGQALDDGPQLFHALPVQEQIKNVDKNKNALPIDLALLGAVPPDVQELAQSRQQLLWQLVQRWAGLIEEIFNEDVWGTKH